MVPAINTEYHGSTTRRFKVSLPFKPYLYLLVSKENIQEVIAFLSKKYGQYITKIDQVFTINQSVLS